MQPRNEKQIVPPEFSGMRLDACAAKLSPDYSRVQIQQSILNGLLTLNGAVIKEKRTAVKTGDVICFTPPENPVPVEADGENIPLNILYEDEFILVISKPAGMVVHPAAGNWTGTVVNAVLGHYSNDEFENSDPLRPGIVHRLDRDTSGCLVIARTAEAMHKLSASFQERRVSKTYLAIVTPAPKLNTAEIITFIGRNTGNRKKMAVVRDEAHGKKAITRFSCVRRGLIDGISAALLEVKILTGRTHQIRVHMSHSGSPVAGDPVYGGTGIPAPRQMLHAWRLTFPHPVTGKELSFEAPIPDDMQNYINKLKEI